MRILHTFCEGGKIAIFLRTSFAKKMRVVRISFTKKMRVVRTSFTTKNARRANFLRKEMRIGALFLCDYCKDEEKNSFILFLSVPFLFSLFGLCVFLLPPPPPPPPPLPPPLPPPPLPFLLLQAIMMSFSSLSMSGRRWYRTYQVKYQS